MKRLATFGTALAMASVVGFYGLHTMNNARAAGNGSIGISPGSSNQTLNNNIVTTISVNPGGATIVGADVTITYDASKLQYQGMTQYSSPFDAELAATHTTGTIRVARATFGAGTSATSNLFQATFKASAAGAANVQVTTAYITSSSDGSNLWNGVMTTSTYTISSPPAATPTPTPVPTAAPNNPTPTPQTSNPTPTASNNNNNNGNSGGNNNSGGSTATPTQSGGGSSNNNGGGTNTAASPTPTPTEATPGYAELIAKPPKIKINQTKKVVFDAETTRPVSAKMDYGLDGQMALSTEQTPFSQTPEVMIPEQYLVPGRTYTYKLVLTDEAGETHESGSGTFRARGYLIKLLVRELNGDPVKNTEVFLHSEERAGATDENGTVTFEDVEQGAHELSLEYDGKQHDLPVSVTANATTDEAGEEVIPLQEQTLVLTASKSAPVAKILLGILALIAVVAGVIFGMRALRQRRLSQARHIPTVAEGAIPITPQEDITASDVEARDDAVITPSVVKPGSQDSHERSYETTEPSALDLPSPVARPGQSIRPSQQSDQNDTNNQA